MFYKCPVLWDIYTKKAKCGHICETEYNIFCGLLHLLCIYGCVTQFVAQY